MRVNIFTAGSIVRLLRRYLSRNFHINNRKITVKYDRISIKKLKGVVIILYRKQLADGIFFNKITDGRYKTNRIAVSFYTDFGAYTRGSFSILQHILADSCAAYPNLKLLTEKFSDLYGAAVNDSFGYAFDRGYMNFVISSIDDRYTLFGESLEEDCCRLLLDCILRPKTEGKYFDSRTTDIMKQELVDAINSVKSEPRSYAAQQGTALAFCGEPVGEPINGTLEQAEQITPQSAFEAYLYMLSHSRIEIFAVGCSEFAATEKILTEELSVIKRGEIKPFPSLSELVSPLKAEVCRKTEHWDMQQAILRMYFKAPDFSDRFSGGVFSMLLGGMPTSRFFANIREKQSLCYYCSCSYSRFKRTLTVYSGVDPSNIGRTEQAVIHELEELCRNGVTEEELSQTKLLINESTRAVYDSPAALTGWYISQLNDEEIFTPEEFIEKINAVSAEDVVTAAKQFRLDTVYALSPTGEGE